MFAMNNKSSEYPLLPPYNNTKNTLLGINNLGKRGGICSISLVSMRLFLILENKCTFSMNICERGKNHHANYDLWVVVWPAITFISTSTYYTPTLDITILEEVGEYQKKKAMDKNYFPKGVNSFECSEI